MSLKDRRRRRRYYNVLVGIFVLPIIAILGFLDVIPVSNALAWVIFFGFILFVIIYFVSFKGKDKGG